MRGFIFFRSTAETASGRCAQAVRWLAESCRLGVLLTTLYSPVWVPLQTLGRGADIACRSAVWRTTLTLITFFCFSPFRINMLNRGTEKKISETIFSRAGRESLMSQIHTKATLFFQREAEKPSDEWQLTRDIFNKFIGRWIIGT